MKKYIIAIVIIAIAAALFLLRGGVRTTPSPSAAIPSATPLNPAASSVTLHTPSGPLEVKNFAKHPVETIGDVVAIAENADYHITYFVKDESFAIALLAKPLQRARDEAEAALLEALGVDRWHACSLKVTLAVPVDVDASLAGRDYGLSFCGNGTALPAS